MIKLNGNPGMVFVLWIRSIERAFERQIFDADVCGWHFGSDAGEGSATV